MQPVPAKWHRVFENSLVFVSTVPYLLYLAFCWTTNHTAPMGGLTTTILLLGLLNLIHVPSTLYLYFDEDIRGRAKRSPIALVIMPLFAIVAFPLAYFWLLYDFSPLSQYLILLSFVGMLTWQAWHFGMQSYGVFAFCSITAQRPKRSVFQAKFEKYCIMAGTIGGMCVVYHALSPYSLVKHLDNVEYAQVEAVANVLYYIGAILSWGAALAALGYFLARRRSFTFNSALVFFVSACFFLPDYFSNFTPYSQDKYAANSVNNFVLIHGLQYLVFLIAHALGRSHKSFSHHAKQRKLNSWIMAFAGAAWPFLTFVISALLIGRVVMARPIMGAMISLGLTQIGLGYLNGQFIAMGFIGGITAAHFIVDRQVWKLSRPDSKAWIMSRYGYVLPQTKAVA